MRDTIIVIGAGLAGLMCSIKCAENGHKVILISKKPSEKSQSVLATGGINAAIDLKNDNTKDHFKDILKAGVFIGDKNAITSLTENAPKIIDYLESIGITFNRREDGKINLRNFKDQKKKRTAFVKDSTGKQIISALMGQVKKYEAQGLIEIYDNHVFLTFVKGKNNECIGGIIQDNINKEILCVNGQAVVICVGGMNGIFGKTTGSILNTGGVASQLFNKGVYMGNLEFIQYYPMTFEAENKRFLVSESALSEGGRLFTYVDGKRWYFLEEWYPEMGKSILSDIISKSIYKVCNEMNILINGEKKVYLDLTHLDNKVLNEKLFSLVEECKKVFKLDPSKDFIPVYPGIHYFMGGIYVNKKHETNIKNLYAAGDCCMQYHGANRIVGNSILGALYGGIVSSQSIEKCFEENVFTDYDNEDIEIFNNNELNNIYMKMKKIKKAVSNIPLGELKEEFHSIMNESLGIIREEEHLANGINTLERLYKEKIQNNYDKNYDEYENFSLRNMIFMGKAILESALRRRESRGAHYRKDYPDINDDYQKVTVAIRKNDEIYISFEECNNISLSSIIK